jgi:hypothetical protein
VARSRIVACGSSSSSTTDGLTTAASTASLAQVAPIRRL